LVWIALVDVGFTIYGPVWLATIGIVLVRITGAFSAMVLPSQRLELVPPGSCRWR
jgi:hypothetical protein